MRAIGHSERVIRNIIHIHHIYVIELNEKYKDGCLSSSCANKRCAHLIRQESLIMIGGGVVKEKEKMNSSN